MYYYNGHIDDFLHGVMNDDVGPREFESWITTNKELLEDYIGMNVYQRLLAIDYTTTSAINHIKEQVKLILDTPTYDHATMCALLTELLENKDAYVKCCRQIYEHYCNGFDFFKDIALTAICYDYDHRLEQPDDLEGFFKEREFIVKEATKILEYLKSGEIRIVETYYYLDRRITGKRL